MQKTLLFLCLCLGFQFKSFAQQPKKPNAVEIYNDLKKLNFLGSVLYVAAHPDDENTRLISYMANEAHARTAYLSLTRGDGGQNLIGPQIREQLGVIRTQELLAARRTDGGEQIFTRANDFGYSKHPDETLAIWEKDEVLADVVWAIRKFQPDIIINRFNHRTPGSTHGHHTSSAMLSVEAFDIVGQKDKFTNQFTYVDPWQPKRLYFNTSWWFYGSREKFEQADKSKLAKVDIGTYYPTLGLSNSEIASLSRSQHKSQGFGSTGTRGTQTEYLELIKGNAPQDADAIFEGIDTSWNRIAGGKAIGDLLQEVEKNFDFTDPSKSLPKLLEAYSLIQNLDSKHWKEIKSEEIKHIISACAGLYLEAVAETSYATPGEFLNFTIEAINRSSVPFQLKSVSITGTDINKTLNQPLKFNINSNLELKGNITTNTYSSPYWLKKEGSLGMYKVDDQKLIGTPENKADLRASFDISYQGKNLTFEKDVVYKTNDPVKGEVYRSFAVVPKVSLSIADKVIIFADNTAKNIPVSVRSKINNLQGILSLQLPEGWKANPENIEVKLNQKNEEKTFLFEILPPNQQNEGSITAQFSIGEQTFREEVISITYDHIPLQTIIAPAQTKVVRLDIEKKGQRIGYIEGAGDVIPESLEQIGYEVSVISPEQISLPALKKFDAVVIGIRAYNTIEALKFRQTALLNYVKEGGNLIVQYNTNRRLKVEENLGPYPIQLSRDRVTDENSEVRLLAKSHPVLNTPNKITQKDFEGWVQERGLYFPNQWSKEYTPILSLNDKGESAKEGALLVAPYGKGYYIYTGLSFFREFPAGVSGAYRLFANLLSLGK